MATLRAVRRGLLLALAGALSVVVSAGAAGAATPVTWCGGSSESALERAPDAVPALSIHVVYAVPADGIDRFADVVSPIVTDLGAAEEWWRTQDATRTLRFDLADFPGCPTAAGRIDVSSVRLTNDAAYYLSDGARYERVRDSLNRAFGDPDKKYLVYYDGPVEDTGLCGESARDFHEGGALAYAEVYLGAECGSTLGQARDAAVVAVHELIHNLGALADEGPPNACADAPGHPCDNPLDILAPTVESGGELAAAQLDAGRDDYYGHGGPWWDVRDSQYLERLDGSDRSPPAPLTGLTAAGPGGPAVELRWRASADDAGPVSYELWRDGVLVAIVPQTSFVDAVPPRVTHGYRIRARDAAGRLGGAQELRFTGGLGVVDAAGRLLRDTVAPSAPTALRGRVTPAALVLRWRAAVDAGGVRGYRLLRNGRLYREVATPTATIPRRSARGTWTVRAVDRAGNVGPGELVRVR